MRLSQVAQVILLFFHLRFVANSYFVRCNSRGRSNSFAALQRRLCPCPLSPSTARKHPTANQPEKDLYEVGEIPPLGHVPKNMYAWVIRRDRHGPPEQSMQLEVVPTHTIGEDEVLVLVMAAGVNYNGVWAGPRPADLARSTSTSSRSTSPAPTPRASSGRSAPR